MTQQLNGAPPALVVPRMTYEEFLEWPHENPHVEWVDGEVVPMAPVTDEHDDITGFVRALLMHFVQAKSLGKVKGDPFQMKPSADLPGRAPDVMVILPQSLPRLHRLYLEGPADLCVEVVSLESRTRDRVHKFKEYEQGGVREYWLIDPLRKQADFYVLGDDRLYHRVSTDDGVFRSTVLSGLWLCVQWLWDRPQLMQVLKEWRLV